MSDEQQKQIAGFVEVNDVASAQRVILDELANRYGGAAAKQAETLGGAWAQLKNEAGNLLEELGDSGLIYVVKGLTTVIKVGLGPFWTAVKMFRWLGEAIDSPYKKLLEIRIAWNQFWGDVEEAKALQAELDWLNDDTDRVKKNGGEAITPKPAEQVAGGKAASGGTATGAAPSRSTRLSRSPAAQSEAAGAFDDIDARAQGARGWASANASNLAQSTPEQSAEFVQQLKKELGAAITEDTLKSVWNWRTNTTDVDLSKFEKLLDVYQASLERMPGFNRKIWDQVKADALRNLDQAARNHGEMRTFYLEATQDALGNAEAMFTDLKKKAEEAKREAEDVVKAAKRAGEKAAKDKADFAEETARAQAEQDKKNMATRKAAPDALSTMQGASRNELNKRLAEMRKQFQQSAGSSAAFGIGTPDQRRGLVAFSNQILDVMRAVRDSTGDTRAANIEQLRQMQDAWAKAFQAIRDGSKETVEQLVGDAMKQGDAGTKAAKQAADAATARTSPIADGINQVFAMSRELSGVFAASLSGIGAAQASFQALAETITDPVEKLTLAIDAAKAQLAGMSINAGNFGGGWEMARAAQANILAMERERTALVRQQTIEREEAARLHEENYRRREQERQAAERDQRREQGLDLSGAVAVGKVPPVVLNINGVNDVRQAVDNLEKELLRRGLHKGGKRKFETK